MRNILRVAALSSALLLGGCASVGNFFETGPGRQFIEEVQRLTATACRFVPYAEMITAVYNGGQFRFATDMAKAFCDAVVATTTPTPQGRRRTARTSVGGVAFDPARDGYFIR